MEQWDELIDSFSRKADLANDSHEVDAHQQEISDGLVSLLDAPESFSGEQRQRLFEVLLPALRPDKPLLGSIFFDVFHSILAFLPFPETRQACSQILHDMAATCNPRELWIVCTEALGRSQPTATHVVLLQLLAQLLQRLPTSSRSRFLRSGLGLAAALVQPRDNGAAHSGDEDDDDEDEDDEEEEEGQDPKTVVKVTNAFGDTDEDLKRKYRLAPHTEVLTRAALGLVRPLASQGPGVPERDEAELVLGFLLAVLAGPVGRAPLEARARSKPHAGYARIASDVLELLAAFGWSADRVLAATRTNPAGVGVYAYLIFAQPPNVMTGSHGLPLVSSSLYTFCQLMPGMSQLLREPAPNKSFKGHRLLVHFTDLLRASYAEQVTEAALAGLGSTLDQWRELCKDVITFMVSNPVESERQSAYQCLGTLFTLLGPWERYRVLGSLLQDCPYAAVAGLLVSRLKDETLRAWPARGSPAGAHCPPFASPKLVDLFPHFMHVKAPLEQLDLLMHGLNFYRFLLLRDRAGQAVVGVWRPELVNWVKARWLTPLRETVAGLQREYTMTLSGEEEQHKQITMLTRHGFPQLSPEQMARASTASLTALAPLTDLLDWVFALLDEHHTQLAPVTAAQLPLPQRPPSNSSNSSNSSSSAHVIEPSP